MWESWEPVCHGLLSVLRSEEAGGFMLGSGGGMGAAGNGEVRSVEPCLMVPALRGSGQVSHHPHVCE